MITPKTRQLVLWMTTACLLPAAQAAAEPSHEMPRSLRDGAPRARLVAGMPAKRAAPPAQRPAPSPSIRLDGPGRTRAGDQQRSDELLQREIALLQRLVARMDAGDPRRADALLRLSQAFQELIWAQKVRLEALRQRAARECECSPSPTAYASR
jgi:hypothetical protein